MAQPVDRDAAAGFLVSRYGPDVAETVAELGAGDWSRAFSFQNGSHNLVVRFGLHLEDFLMDKEAMVYARPELPVPTVLEIGEALGGYYAISERHYGIFLEALDEGGWRRLLPALMRALDALREIQPGSGGTSPSSWRAWLLGSLEDRPGTRVSGWRAKLKEAPEVYAVFAAGEAALPSLVKVCPEAHHVLHRDLINRNVLVTEDASRLEAVFDWGCSTTGDFLYEVAWLTFWAPWYPALEAIDFRRAVEEHYQHIGLTVEHFDQRMSCYELQIGLEHIAYSRFTGREDDMQAVTQRTRQVLERV